jgi:hypothetical protein
MTRTRTLEQGVEEWSCAECSRRLLLRRPPQFEQIVLERGDEWASHVGATGGFQMAGIQAHRAGPDGPSASERGWLDEHGIAWGSDGSR